MADTIEIDEKTLTAIKEIKEHLVKTHKSFEEQIAGKVTKDELASYKGTVDEIKASLDKLNAELEAGEAEDEVVEESVKQINLKLEKVETKMTELLEDVAAVKEKGAKRAKAQGEFLTSEQIEKFIKDSFNLETKEKKGVHTTLNMEFKSMVRKAAEDFNYPTFFQGTPGGAIPDFSAFTGRVIDPELYQRRRKRNLILDYFDIATVNAPQLLYLEKVEISGQVGSSADTGGADWIASGVQKPKRSFRVTTGKVEAKKVAIFGTVADELLMDVPSLENWIREDFTDEIKETYNDALLNNNPAIDADAPLGLKQNAIQFTPTLAFDNTVVSPTYIDEIVAAAALMADLKEEGGMAFVSWDVYYRIISLKDNEARYMKNEIVYTNNLGQLFIAGVEIVPVDKDDVPSTHLLLIGKEVGFKIRNYGPMVFERGHNGNDFREDKTSYRGYQRVLSYIPNHRENSVLYDTWANIRAGIVAP